MTAFAIRFTNARNLFYKISTIHRVGILYSVSLCFRGYSDNIVSMYFILMTIFIKCSASVLSQTLTLSIIKFCTNVVTLKKKVHMKISVLVEEELQMQHPEQPANYLLRIIYKIL